MVSQSITSRQVLLHCRYSDVTLLFHCGYLFTDDPVTPGKCNNSATTV
jgi:hypothetical protein